VPEWIDVILLEYK